MPVTILSPATLGLSGRRPLHLCGVVPPPPRLAVVGSRAAHHRFREAVAPVVEAAAGRGFAVVSGGAVGIDAEVHAAALAGGVPQLAVLPCGPDRPYPPQHAPLFARIAAARDSGVLHAHGPGTVPTRAMFASRNAIVVALCEAVVVVEAAPRSGTMLTATLARRRGRARAVVTGSAGAAILAAEGAHALPWDRGAPRALGEAVDAWLRAVAAGEPEPAPKGRVWPEHLAWLREALASAGPAGLGVDALEQPRAALLGLCEAEALGLCVERAPGRYVATG